jgi:hypothetical protein
MEGEGGEAEKGGNPDRERHRRLYDKPL